MGRLRLLALVVAVTLGAGVMAGTAASATRSHAARAELLYFFKQTSQSLPKKFTPGATAFFTYKMYLGTSAHHDSNWTATAILYCTIKKGVTKTKAPATCDGVIAIGGSMLVSVSTQNLGSSKKTTVYPILAGTGNYLGAGGKVTTTTIGKGPNANGVIIIT